MEYRIIWSHFSEIQIDEIYSYYEEIVNSELAGEIVRNILLAPNQLTKNPKMGTPEPLLKGRATEYRYIITTNYKIIYSVDEAEKYIKISDVFDTRQNPGKIEKRTK